jgi:membrane-associated protease RseP (regulator of RpoE activity)
MFSVNMIPHPYFEESKVEKDRTKTPGDDSEYLFRYPIDDSRADHISLNDLPARHLRALLDLITLTWKGEEVRIDGYRSLSEPDLVHPLFSDETREVRQSENRLDIYEPRLTYIRTLIESLLSIVEFENKKEPLQIDGFRIKKPTQWLRPGGGTADILAQAATRCNLNCRFCYNLGSPPAFQNIPRRAEEEYQEVLTRIAYYFPKSKLGIFPDAGSPCEMLSHPYILEILTALRRKTSEIFRIPTNGSQLTPEIIQALVRFQPLFVDISLISSSAVRRQWLMRDPHPETALNAPAALQEARIPYSVVIVPWPFPSTEEMMEDLVRTVTFSDRFYPAFIQISLPGYSERFSQENLFDREEVWNRIKDQIQHLRTKTKCPLILRPGLFEEYLDPESVDAPQLIGVIKNSPADRAGLKIGDRLIAINGLPIKTRPQALSLFRMVQGSRLERVSLTVARPNGPNDLSLELNHFNYPFDPAIVPYAGCVFPSSGIPLEWSEQIKNLIKKAQASEVLLFTSTLVRPTLEKRIRENYFPEDIKLHLRVPPNRSLGGNIFMGDLLMVEDFIGAVKEFLKESQRTPDLIIIPSSPFHLSGWGRDLSGRVYTEIERITGIPVGLVQCDPIFD